MSSSQGSPLPQSNTPAPFATQQQPMSAMPGGNLSGGAQSNGNPFSTAIGTPTIPQNMDGNNKSPMQQYSPPLISHNMKLAGQLIPGINPINDFLQKPFAASTALSAATFGLSDMFGIGRKNSSPQQDITAALMAGHPVKDSDWAKAGYGPGGAGLNGAPDFFSAQLGINGSPGLRAPQYSNPAWGLPGNYNPAQTAQSAPPAQSGPSLAQANPSVHPALPGLLGAILASRH